MTESENLRNRAETIFRKKTVAREGERAMEDYKLEQRAMQEKTARLRTLRLARDAKRRRGAETRPKPFSVSAGGPKGSVP
jgi:hypothetical protein